MPGGRRRPRRSSAVVPTSPALLVLSESSCGRGGGRFAPDVAAQLDKRQRAVIGSGRSGLQTRLPLSP